MDDKTAQKPEEYYDPELEGLDFWETHASLMKNLKSKGLDEIFKSG